jgi:hypothetical protein
MARPSEFSQETADYICEQLIEGRSLRSICADDEDVPSASTICRWLSANEEFRKQYAHARELQADALFDESLDIADDMERDLVPDEKEETVVRGNGVAVQRARLRVDTRKWMASKLAPKRYGDKLELSGDPDSPHRIEIVSRVVNANR